MLEEYLKKTKPEYYPPVENLLDLIYEHYTENKTEPVTDKYRAAYRLVAEPGSSEYEKENKAMVDDGLLWLEFYKNIPDDFAEMIKEIMKRKGITQENLSFELGVDRKALVNYLNQDRPLVAHVVGTCVALKVPYFISMEILGETVRKLG